MATSTIKAPSKLQFLLSTTAKTFTLSNGLRAKMTFYDSNLDYSGEYIIRTTGNGSFAYKAISAVSGITIAGATNALTLTASAGTPFVVFEVIQGTIAG